MRDDPLGEQERVRAEPEEIERDREHLRHDGEEVGPGEGRHPDRFADHLAGSGQVGPEHRADGRRPHHERQVAAPGGIRGEVSGGEPRLEVGGLPRSDQAECQEQEREGLPTETASTTSTTPASAMTIPVVRASRRPQRRANAASGIASAAVPRVTPAAARPENASSPEISAASTAPSEMVAPNASPPRICPIESTQTVRR